MTTTPTDPVDHADDDAETSPTGKRPVPARPGIAVRAGDVADALRALENFRRRSGAAFGHDRMSDLSIGFNGDFLLLAISDGEATATFTLAGHGADYDADATLIDLGDMELIGTVLEQEPDEDALITAYEDEHGLVTVSGDTWAVSVPTADPFVAYAPARVTAGIAGAAAVLAVITAAVVRARRRN